MCTGSSKLAAGLLCALAACAAPAMPEAGVRTFVFESVTGVPAGAAAEADVLLWIPVPASNGYQDVADPLVTIEPPVRGGWKLSTDPVTGNRMVHVVVGSERAAAEVVVSVRCTVCRRATNPGGLPDGGGTGSPAAFLRPQPLIPLDGPVGEMAATVPASGDAFATGRRLFDSVRATMTYDKTVPGWGRGDAVRACSVGKGNCTDYHSLFIGMARALGIPARFTMGYSLDSRPTGASTLHGYHCWAEYWVAGRGWVPVDISEADRHPERSERYFGRLPPDRVALSSGRHLHLVPEQAGEPLNWLLEPYAERGGEVFPGIQHEATALDI